MLGDGPGPAGPGSASGNGPGWRTSAAADRGVRPERADRRRASACRARGYRATAFRPRSVRRQQAVGQLGVVRGLLRRQRDRVGQLEQIADRDVGAYGPGLLGAEQQGAARLPHRAAAPGEVRTVVPRGRHERACEPSVLARVRDDLAQPVHQAAHGCGASSNSRERASRSLTASSKTALIRACRFGKWRYSVPMPTPARRATSSSEASVPCSANAERASVSSRRSCGGRPHA